MCDSTRRASELNRREIDSHRAERPARGPAADSTNVGRRIPKPPTRSLLLPLALLALTASGCTLPYRSFSFAEEEPARRRLNVVEKEELGGLRVAATLLADSESCRRYFGHPLVDSGLVPVLLHLENPGGRDYVLERDRVRWIIPDAANSELEPVDPETLIRRYRKAMGASWWGLPLIFPFLEERARIRAYNHELARDYFRKSLPAGLQVRAGDSSFTRALFFRVTPEQRQVLTRKSDLLIPLRIKAARDPETGDPIPGGEIRIAVGLP